MTENSERESGDDANRRHQLEAVIADYIRGCEAGSAPDQHQILERHAELADELRQFFGQHDRMNQIAAPIRGFGDSLAQAVGPGQLLSYIGNYELLEEIARGGMGVVYKARQTTLGRVVAVKMIISGRLASEQDVQRFQVEAQAAAGLQHPNIVSIHEVGQHEGWHYFSMDYVEGRDLAKILRENLLLAKQAATYVRQMAEAIHYAHQKGILHRDLKPSNILIDSHDQVRITDFGLAMRVEGGNDLTHTGQIVGTPSYMPPEQAQGNRCLIGPGSDVYSLGAVLYECLTGRAPFRADSVLKTIEQVIHVEAASPRLLNPGIPRDLETICLKCLQKEPHRRYGTAQLLAEDLQRFREGRPILARPVTRLAGSWRWCRRNPMVAGLTGLIAVLVISASLAGIMIRRAVLQQQQIARAESLVAALMHADTTQVPSIVTEIQPFRAWVEPLLNRQFDQAADRSAAKLHTALALLPSDTGKAKYVQEEMLHVTEAQFPVLRDALSTHSSPSIASLWVVATESDADVHRRFQAACALATYAPDDLRWQSIREFVAERLVTLEASELVAWRTALRPARLQLLVPLSVIYRRTGERQQSRIYAAETLADFAADRPDTLFDLLTDADESQFAVLFRAMQRHPDKLIALGAKLLSTPVASNADDEETDVVARRRASTAVALYLTGTVDSVFPLMQHSPDPRARSYLIHWLAARGGDPQPLLRQLDAEKDASIRCGLILAIGEFSEVQLPVTSRPPIIGKLVELYVHDPDAGLHAASEWLLRKWDQQELIGEMTGKLMGLLPQRLQQWYVDFQGRTFVVVKPGDFIMGSPLTEPDRVESEFPHQRLIVENFAIASHEVTREQFQAFTRTRIAPASDQQNLNSGDIPQIVTWYEAAAYCNWLSERAGIPSGQWCYLPNSNGEYSDGMRAKPMAGLLRGYRLPTEAEWEYACRAGSQTSRSYGTSEELLAEYGWYQFKRNNQLRTVGLLKPNDFGLFDTLGNAYEWCHNQFQGYPRPPARPDSRLEYAIDPSIVENNSRRVLRGGAFTEHPLKLRSAGRVSNIPDTRGGIEGFRPVQTYYFPTEEERAADAAIEPVIKRQIQLLWQRDERSIAAAVRLGEAGAAAAPAIPALNAAFNDQIHDRLRSQLTTAAGIALGQIGPAAVPVLLKAAGGAKTEHRDIAIQALILMEKNPSEAALAIRNSLKDLDPTMRRAAVLALVRLFGETGVLDGVQSRLKDEDRSVRSAAAIILGANSTTAQSAIPSLLEAARDREPLVARAAITALGRIGADSGIVVSVLITIVQDGSSSQRNSAMSALGQLGPAAKAAVPVVVAALNDNDLAVRAGARQTLQRIEPQLAATLLGPPFDAVAASLEDRLTLEVGPLDWPQWGGSRQRNNTPTGENIPTEWDIMSGKNIKWTSKLGSETYGNPCVANGKIFIGTNNGNGYLQRFPASVDLGVILCLKEATGKFLWQYSSPKLATGRVHDWPNQGMPSTPLADGNRLWATTNRGEVVCLDAEGFHDGDNDGPFRDEANENTDEADIIWRFDMIKELSVSPHNMSNCSILMADGLLFVCTSNGVDEGHFEIPSPDAPSFFALDRDTGKVLWTDNSPGRNILHGQWASASYGIFGDQPQVLFPGGDGWLYSFDPDGDGLGNSKLLWKFDCNPKKSIYTLTRATRNLLIGFTCIYDGFVYIAVGEDPERGQGQGHLWCIDPTKRGDVSPTIVYNSESPNKPIPHKRIQALDEKAGDFERENPNSAAVWHYVGEDPSVFETTMHRTMGTVAIRDDVLYVLDLSGLFHCVNAKSGKAHWTYDLFAECWGSALIVDGKVYIGDEDGEVAIFKHTADPAVFSGMVIPLAEMNLNAAIYSTPVVANNVLYVATRNMLYAIESVK